MVVVKETRQNKTKMKNKLEYSFSIIACPDQVKGLFCNNVTCRNCHPSAKQGLSIQF